MKQTGQTVVLTLVRKKPRALERSLDKGRSDLFQLHVFVVQTSKGVSLLVFDKIICKETVINILLLFEKLTV